MAQDAIIQARDLTKSYGRHRGIEDVTFDVHRGEVFGFLGPNGAGKTTTIRILMDLIRPTGGGAWIFGLDVGAGGLDIRRRVGYLPGELRLYEHMRGEDFLRYLGNLQGDLDWGEVERLGDRLGADLDRRLGELSSGNKQKIGIIQALMHRSELLILDEPTGGLDPLIQHEFHGIVFEAVAEGRTVFLSSHILPEVEALCHRVGIIREGRLVAVEEIDALKARALRRLEIQFAAAVPPEAFATLPGVRDVSVQDSVVRCTVVGALDAVIKAAARFEVVNVVSDEPALEEIFLSYYGGTDAP